uniref:Lysosome-associated membrane glycoprotein 2-like luminal domain-containing protein n=1 Tax=Sphenodon punctatus TaxID=8508 RepID=A0A8D0L9H5_SPHPU
MNWQHLELLIYTVVFSSCLVGVVENKPEDKPMLQSTSFLQRTASTQSPLPPQITSSSHAATMLGFSGPSKMTVALLSHSTTGKSGQTVMQTTKYPVTTDIPYETPQTRIKSTQLTGQTTHALSTTSVEAMATAKLTLSTNQITTAVRKTTSKPTPSTNQTATVPKTTISKRVTSANQTTTVAKTTISKPVTSANQTTTVAKRTTSKPVTSPNQTTAYKIVATTAKINTTTVKPTINATTQSANQTTHSTANTTAITKVTTIHPANTTTASTTTQEIRPTLAPKPSPTPTGTYKVVKGNVTCIKASMGLAFIITDVKSKPGYLNVDPKNANSSGTCENKQSTLKVSFDGGFVAFTFEKNGDVYDVSKIEASLLVPLQKLKYQGVKTGPLFQTPVGHSYKCLSKQTEVLTSRFQLLLLNTQFQAFEIVNDQFGKEEECNLDRSRRIVPIAVGLSLFGLFIIVFVTCFISRRKPDRGYEHI